MRITQSISLCVFLTLGTVWTALPAQAPETIRMRVAWEVVEGKHATADSLGELSGIAVDGDGNVYVSDFSATKVWVFDRAGRSQAAIGRKGQGPGEFAAPTGIAIGPDGRLYVRDQQLVTRFAADPTTKRLTRYESSFRGPLMNDWRSTRASRFDTAGRLYYPGFNTISRTRRTGFFHRYTTAGILVDSLEVPAFPNAPLSTASIMVSANSGRMLPGLNHVPFAPLPVWDVTPRGTLLLGDAQDYAIRETDASGRERRVYRRTVPRTRIPEQERRDSAAALRARLDSVPVPLDRVIGMPSDVRAVRLPESYPPYMAVYGAPDGRVWVRRWPGGGGETSTFDVFEADGRLSAVVVLPRMISVSVTPVLSLRGIAAVGVDSETGANTILRFAADR